MDVILYNKIGKVENAIDLRQVPAPTKNLITLDYETDTVNGVTFTVNEDNSISLSGTPTANIYWPDYHDISLRFKLPAGTYTFSAGDASDTWRTPTLLLYENREDTAQVEVYTLVQDRKQLTITTEQDYWAFVRFFIDGRNTELSSYTFYQQIEAGSVATEYVSPWGTKTETSVDDVKDAIGFREKVVKSKNLNATPYASDTVSDVTFTVAEDNSVALSGTPSKNIYWPNVSDTDLRWKLPIGTYTLSSGSISATWRDTTILLYDTKSAATQSLYYSIGNNKKVTFTTTQEYWAAIRFFINKNNSDLTGYVYKAQLEAGQNVTQYVSPWDSYAPTSDVEDVKEDIEDINDGMSEIRSMISGASLNDALNPKPVIFDTDIGGDSDDALAVRVLSYFESIGSVRIVMASSVNNTIHALRGLSALLEYDGTLDVPIVLKDSNYSTTSYGVYLNVLESYPHSKENSPSIYGFEAYRKVLAGLSNKATLIFVGPLTNLSDLLDSPADSYSELTGMELVTAKVDKIYVMGGAFPDSVTAMDGEGATVDGVKVPGAEWNFAGDIPATANVIENCPVPMIFLGWEIGKAIPCGGSIDSKLPANDAVIAVLDTHGGSSEVSTGRSGWDPLTTAIACLGNAEKMGFALVRGTVNYNSVNSTNTFTESGSGTHYYVAKKYDNDYYKIYMNHILSKDWWGNNNTANLDRGNIT